MEILKLFVVGLLFLFWLVPVIICFFNKDESDGNIVWVVSSLYTSFIFVISYLLLN